MTRLHRYVIQVISFFCRSNYGTRPMINIRFQHFNFVASPHHSNSNYFQFKLYYYYWSTASISKRLVWLENLGCAPLFGTFWVNRIVEPVENLLQFPGGDWELGKWGEWGGVKFGIAFTVYHDFSIDSFSPRIKVITHTHWRWPQKPVKSQREPWKKINTYALPYKSLWGESIKATKNWFQKKELTFIVINRSYKRYFLFKEQFKL